VRLPLEHERAPVSVIVVYKTDKSGDTKCSGFIAYSYNSATVGLWTTFGLLIPKFCKNF
jgi:hypothetical protein